MKIHDVIVLLINFLIGKQLGVSILGTVFINKFKIYLKVFSVRCLSMCPCYDKNFWSSVYWKDFTFSYLTVFGVCWPKKICTNFSKDLKVEEITVGASKKVRDDMMKCAERKTLWGFFYNNYLPKNNHHIQEAAFQRLFPKNSG